MTWTDLTFAFGSILTATKMTQLDDNFEALANGDSGSPKIQEAAITGQAAVDRSALKTATQSTNGSVSAGSKVNITLGSYSFFPMIHASHTTTIGSLAGHTTDAASADSPRFAFVNTSSTKGATSYTYDVDSRYVAA